MEIINFTPLSATVGGVLIGLSAALLLALHGKIAGISGMLSGLLSTQIRANLWRALFIIGVVLGAILGLYCQWGPTNLTITSNKILIIVGGLLVGFGTVFGGGCTSGHGVCGISRLSKRSIIATITFMVTALIVVFVKKNWF